VVDLKRLGHLVALADECHFARAAERVHLSQPAFSRSIQSVERDVGMKLFDRETGDVKLTPAGVFLVERARRLLFDARCLQRDTALYRDSQLGDTAFGAGPFPTATIMPLAMSALRRRYPGVALRLETSNWELLYERLLAEDIEFFIGDVRDLPAEPRIEVSALGRLAGHLYARAGHPLAGQVCTFAQVWQLGVATTKLPSRVGALLTTLRGLGPGEKTVPAVECDDLPLLCALALATDTVVGLPDAWVERVVRDHSLVQLRVADLPAVYAEMGVVTLVNRTPSPMAQRAIACIREIARDLSTVPEGPTSSRRSPQRVLPAQRGPRRMR
jgi:DNA-binding transcriptional LysR family regulator